MYIMLSENGEYDTSLTYIPNNYLGSHFLCLLYIYIFNLAILFVMSKISVKIFSASCFGINAIPGLESRWEEGPFSNFFFTFWFWDYASRIS